MSHEQRAESQLRRYGSVFALLGMALALAACGDRDDATAPQAGTDDQVISTDPADLGPGRGFIYVMETYIRQGDAMELVRSSSEVYFPERFVSTMTVGYGEDGELVILRAEVRGADGELIQQAMLEDGDVIVRDGSGRVMDAHLVGAESLDLETMRTGMIQSSAARLERVRSDDQTEEVIDGETMVLRQPAFRPIPPARGYSLPHFGDLEIKSAYHEYVFDRETEQMLRQSFYGVTPAGEVIELETMVVTRFVVVPLEALE